jgi:hypothetical protein
MSSGPNAIWKTLFAYSDVFSFIPVCIFPFKDLYCKETSFLSGLDLATWACTFNLFMPSAKESSHITGYWQGWQFFKLIGFLALKIILLKEVLSEEIRSKS